MGRRIEREKATVAIMIRMYCHGKRHAEECMCKDCAELFEYAVDRLDRCPHGDRKPACRRCRVHCYRRDMRERIGTVMRWSGKRMILYHPVAALRHILGR